MHSTLVLCIGGSFPPDDWQQRPRMVGKEFCTCWCRVEPSRHHPADGHLAGTQPRLEPSIVECTCKTQQMDIMREPKRGLTPWPRMHMKRLIYEGSLEEHIHSTIDLSSSNPRADRAHGTWRSSGHIMWRDLTEYGFV